MDKTQAQNMTEADWKKKLTPEQYHVLREKGTEVPNTGKYVNHDENGDYRCAACSTVLFKSDTKYESTLPGLIGWPAFSDAADNGAVDLVPDSSLGTERTEVVCATCGSHLGHLFEGDPSSPNGVHYCINSAALEFEKQ